MLTSGQISNASCFFSPVIPSFYSLYIGRFAPIVMSKCPRKTNERFCFVKPKHTLSSHRINAILAKHVFLTNFSFAESFFKKQLHINILKLSYGIIPVILLYKLLIGYQLLYNQDQTFSFPCILKFTF